MRAKGLGADVIVTEIDPTKAIEAVMDGFRVMPMTEAAKIGDIFVTVTGNKSVLAHEHFERMKDGAVICNSGHFNVEIDIPALEKLSSGEKNARPFVEEYSMKDGRTHLSAGRRPPDQSRRRRRPSGLRDGYELRQPGALRRVHGEARHGAEARRCTPVPEHLDQQIAKLKLESMGVQIDKLTPEQEHYLASWYEGT